MWVGLGGWLPGLARSRSSLFFQNFSLLFFRSALSIGVISRFKKTKRVASFSDFARVLPLLIISALMASFSTLTLSGLGGGFASAALAGTAFSRVTPVTLIPSIFISWHSCLKRSLSLTFWQVEDHQVQLSDLSLGHLRHLFLHFGEPFLHHLNILIASLRQLVF